MGALVIMVSLALVMGTAHAATLDPTAPPLVVSQSSDVAATAAPELAWVRLAGKRSIAWYDGQVVHLGDSVRDGRVVSIREDRIEIQGAGRRQVVYLMSPATNIRRR